MITTYGFVLSKQEGVTDMDIQEKKILVKNTNDIHGKPFNASMFY